MSDRTVEAGALQNVSSSQAAYFLGFTAEGKPVMVNADTMLIYRGAIPDNVNISIDDPALPMGVYALNGGAEGTFPESTFGAAKLIQWRASGGIPRAQIYVSYWTDKMYIRRYTTSSGWKAWTEVSMV